MILSYIVNVALFLLIVYSIVYYYKHKDDSLRVAHWSGVFCAFAFPFVGFVMYFRRRKVVEYATRYLYAASFSFLIGAIVNRIFKYDEWPDYLGSAFGVSPLVQILQGTF